MYCGLTGDGTFKPQQTFYLVPATGSGALLWPFYIDTRLMEDLSRLLDCPVHWISADEEMRTWAYLEHSDGELRSEVLDPEYLLRAAVVRGEDLSADGPRRYQDLASFERAIANRYMPKDRVWRFGKWHDPFWREEILADPQVEARRAVRLTLSGEER